MTNRPDFLLQRTWLLGLLCLSCQRAPATRSKPLEAAGPAAEIDSGALVRLVDSAMLAGMARESIPGAAIVLVRRDRVEVHFASADGRRHLGFAQDQAGHQAGRIIALTAGSWRVLERVD